MTVQDLKVKRRGSLGIGYLLCSALLFTSVAQATTAVCGEIYTSLGTTSATSTGIFRIDKTTGTVTNQVTTNTGGNVGALALMPNLTFHYTSEGSSRVYATYDSVTDAEAKGTATLTRQQGQGASLQGDVYRILFSGRSSANQTTSFSLFKMAGGALAPTTTSTITVPYFMNPGAGDVAFGPDGLMYMYVTDAADSNTSYLFVVNPDTGEVLRSTPNFGPRSTIGVAFDNDGFIYTTTQGGGTLTKLDFGGNVVGTAPLSDGNKSFDLGSCVIPLTLQNDSATTPASTPVNIPVKVNDSGGSLPNAGSVEVTLPGGGKTFTNSDGKYDVNPDNTVTFTPAVGFTGVTTPVTYTGKLPSGISSTATITVTVTQPSATPVLSIAKTDNNLPFAPGSTGKYTVTVSNALGAANTTGAITLSDLLPTGMSFVDVTTTTAGTLSNKSASGSTGQVGWSFTPTTALAGGQNISFTVTVNVANTVASDTTLTNYVAVGGGGDVDPLPTPGPTCTTDQCAKDDTLIKTPAPILTIDKADADASFANGGTGVYTLLITNTGDAPTSGAITVREAFPAGYNFVSASSSNGTVTGGTVGSAGAQTFTVTPTAPLQPGQSLTLSVTGSINTTATSITNRASVGGGGAGPAPDPATCTPTTPLGNCDAEPTPILQSSTALGIRKTGPATAQIGERITYTIKIWNPSGTNIRNATFNDPLPSNLSQIQYSCDANPETYNFGVYYENDCTAASSTDSRDIATTTLTGNNLNLSVNLQRNGSLTGSGITITVSGVVTAGTFTNTASITSGTNTSYSSATTNVPLLPPLECKNTMYAITRNGGTDTSPIYNQVRSLTTSGVLGSTAVTTLTSENVSAALAINSDGTKIYSVPIANTSAASRSLQIYDVTTNTTSSVLIDNYTTGQRMLRMVIDSNGIGYMTTGTDLWTFDTTVSGLPTIEPRIPLSYTDTSGLTPTPSPGGNGDLIASETNDIFLIQSPVTNTSTSGGYIDIFKLKSDGTLRFYGRISGVPTGKSYGGAAAIGQEIYVSSAEADLLKLNLADLTATAVPNGTTLGSTLTGSSDLSSCAYPSLVPAITVTKSVTKVAGSAGDAVVAGDTLEYTIVTRNAGTISTSGSTLQDTVPAGTTYVPNSTTLNFTAVADTTGTGNARMPFSTARDINSPGAGRGVVEVDKTLDTITTGSTDTVNNEVVVKFRVTVNAGTTEIRNTAAVADVDRPTPIPSNETVTPTGAPNLSIIKSVDTSYVKVQHDASTNTIASITPQDVIYTITVSNTGTAAASNISVSDAIPAGMTYRGVETGTPAPTSAPAVGAGGTLTWTGLNVAAGSSQTLRIRVRPTIVANTPVSNAPYLNTAQLTNGANTLSSETVRTDVVYEKLGKSVRNVTTNGPLGTSAQGQPGDVLEYCLPYNNYGSTTLESYIIRDDVPVNVLANTQVADYNGNGIALKRAGTTTFLTAATDGDAGALSTTGGANNKGQLTVNLGTVARDEAGEACFRVTIP